MGLAGAGAADQHEVALLGEEASAGEVADQGLVDRRGVEDELVDVLGHRQPGDGDLVLDGTGLLLGELGSEQVAHDPLGFVLALHRGSDDLVSGRSHAVARDAHLRCDELEVAHCRHDRAALHHLLALLRLS